jgi:hypothetical protein
MSTFVIQCDICPNLTNSRYSEVCDGIAILIVKADGGEKIEEIARRHLAESDWMATDVRRIGTITRRRVRDSVECLSVFEECQRKGISCTLFFDKEKDGAIWFVSTINPMQDGQDSRKKAGK